MNNTTHQALTAALSTIALLSACAAPPASTGRMPDGAMSSNQSGLPEAVRVPGGHRVALETVGVGEITYECRAKANAAGPFEWVFVGPQADLTSRAGARLGRYYGPPATWASSDGSTITGTQVAVAPAMAGSLPLQLVKAHPASGPGAMMGITYVQRLATRGGVAPAVSCDAATLGRKEIVKYQADYIFWKTA